MQQEEDDIMDAVINGYLIYQRQQLDLRNMDSIIEMYQEKIMSDGLTNTYMLEKFKDEITQIEQL